MLKGNINQTRKDTNTSRVPQHHATTNIISLFGRAATTTTTTTVYMYIHVHPANSPR